MRHGAGLGLLRRTNFCLQPVYRTSVGRNTGQRANFGEAFVALKTSVFIPEQSVSLRRPRGEFHPVFNVIVTVAMPMIMSVYVGIAQKAAQRVIETAKAWSRPKPWLPGAIGALVNDLRSAELHLKDMIRLANDLDFLPENSLGQEILCRKTNAVRACEAVAARAMEIAGGAGFHQNFGLERLFRDMQAAKYHPLPEKEQQPFLGEYVLASGEDSPQP